MKRVLTLLVAAFVISAIHAESGKTSTSELSQVSNDGTSSAIFSPYLDLQVDNFHHDDEFATRRGMPNFMAKCMAGEEVKIGYIGGSITYANYMWRKQSAYYIASMFPEAIISGINAARGGTGSDIGACRMDEHMMQYKPDMVFIEFAVNAANEHGVEGIIRKIIMEDPTIDICLVYTIYRGQAQNYADGEIPFNVARLEKVAKYYNLPSIHMGMQAGFLERDGKLLWEGTAAEAGRKILFSHDGVHPATAGGDLYASAVARCFEAMKSNVGESKMELPAPLSPRQMDRAKYLEPSLFGLEDWEKSPVTADNENKNCILWFENIYSADAQSSPLKFKFKGDYLAILDTASPDSGDIDIYVDGKKWIVTEYNRGRYGTGNGVAKSDFFDADDPRCSVNRFFSQSTEVRDRDIISFTLEEGIHEIEVRVHDEPINKAERLKMSDEEFDKVKEKYEGQRFNLGKVLINGDIIK